MHRLVFSQRTLAHLLAAVLAAAAGACDGGARSPDARVRPNTESAEVSVRFDVSPGKATTVHVLAFRASVSAAAGGIDPADVLGTVDPLAAPAPEQGCALRDVDVTTSALGARGASIELEELTGIGVGLGGPETLLRPFPRLFPDVATVIGGVVAEAGPLVTAAVLPERVNLYTADVELPVAELAVPAAPRIAAIDGMPLGMPLPPGGAPAPTFQLSGQDAIAVTVVGGAGGVVELRPFGATVAAACAIPSTAATETVVSIPAVLVARVVGSSTPTSLASRSNGNVAASLEVARRNRLRQVLKAPATRISVEVRSATTVELRP